MASILYLSYDGLTDQLGPSQILAYLLGLAKRDHRVTLITCEKPGNPGPAEALSAQCREAGIDWHPLPYTKRPPILSTLHDLRAMTALAERLVGGGGFDVVHCRSYLPALVGARLKRRHGLRFLFDMRGFWADERVEGGLWPQSNPLFRMIFRWFKLQEARLLREADHVVVLTEAGRKILHDTLHVPADKAITVIPCCADFTAFPPVTAEARTAARARLGIPSGVPVIGYLGALGTWYMLPEMLDFVAVARARDPGTQLLMVTREPPAPIIAAAAQRGIPAEAIIIRSAQRDEVPRLMAAANTAIFFIRPTFSKLGSSPVKLGELLSLELPVIANSGVGDVDRIIREAGAGVLVDHFETADYGAALDGIAALRPDMERWSRIRGEWFDLATGIARYDEIYRSLGSDRNSSISRGA